MTRHRRSPTRAGAIVALLAGGFATVGLVDALPAGAGATCTFDKQQAIVTVTVTGGLIMRVNGGTIELGGVPCTTGGGVAATVTNTDTINVTGDGNDQLFPIGLELPFAPGKTDEPGGSDEIEWSIDLGGGDDLLDLFGADTGDAIQISAADMNLNADETTLDSDGTFAGVESLAVFAGHGDDVVDATGFAGDAELHGSDGSDTVTGGSGPDRIYGEDGDDTLAGGLGNDSLDDGAGDDSSNGGSGDDNLFMGESPNGADTVAGGSGTDYASYYGRTVDLIVTIDNAANDGDPSANGGAGENDDVRTDVENVSSGPGADRIVGSGRANVLLGGDGKDQITGKGNGDSLQGGNGNDRFFAMDGVVDVVNGAAGTDSCQCDATDQLIDIP
jgi:Ca2+-binding RTX toxin-like protein